MDSILCSKCNIHQAKLYNGRFLSHYCLNCATDKMSKDIADSYVWELAKREV